MGHGQFGHFNGGTDFSEFELKYIDVTTYLMGRVKLEDLPDDQVRNLNILIVAVNTMFDKWGQSRPCNSGYRTAADQARINPKVTQSKHMIAAAIDLSDINGDLNRWLKANPKIMVELGLYGEERQGNWQHLQIISPRSGKLFFIP